MKTTILLFPLFFITLLNSSCYGEMTATVVDAETGKPIEGAVVLVEWTVTKGLPGMSYHEVYKIIEVETDKAGRFSVSGTYNPLVDPPDVVVYNAGYVAWRKDYIFPGWKRRTDFEYRGNLVIKLEKFKEEYSYKEHLNFIEYGVHLYKTDSRKLYNAIQMER